MRLIKLVGDWFDQRLQLGTPIRETMEHPVPRQTASWAYVFGSAALTVFILQLVTGILLALLYVPSAGEAWNSLQILNHQVTLGWFIRALHGWGSNFMLAIVLIHMVQVFLFGAYKFPRELTWIVGVLLLLLTLGMAFTGQVLRFDQDAYWGLGIGASIASRVPVLGPLIVNLLLGGPIIAERHALAILRAARVRDSGIADWIRRSASAAGPEAGNQRMADAWTNRSPRNLHAGISRADAQRRHSVCARRGLEGLVFLRLHSSWRCCCAPFISARSDRAASPIRPSSRPCPSRTIFSSGSTQCCRLLPPSMETPVLLIGPVIGIVVLLALPFFSGEGEKSWKRRPIAVLTILLVAVSLGTFTNLSGHAPWSPVMDAWSGEPIPAEYLKGRTALERQGALVFQAQAVPQLPLAGWRRRQAWAGAGSGRCED